MEKQWDKASRNDVLSSTEGHDSVEVARAKDFVDLKNNKRTDDCDDCECCIELCCGYSVHCELKKGHKGGCSRTYSTNHYVFDCTSACTFLIGASFVCILIFVHAVDGARFNDLSERLSQFSSNLRSVSSHYVSQLSSSLGPAACSLGNLMSYYAGQLSSSLGPAVCSLGNVMSYYAGQLSSSLGNTTSAYVDTLFCEQNK